MTKMSIVHVILTCMLIRQAEANPIVDGINNIQLQMIANGVVLAFGTLCGNGTIVTPFKAILNGPFSVLGSWIWLIKAEEKGCFISVDKNNFGKTNQENPLELLVGYQENPFGPQPALEQSAMWKNNLWRAFIPHMLFSLGAMIDLIKNFSNSANLVLLLIGLSLETFLRYIVYRMTDMWLESHIDPEYTQLLIRPKNSQETINNVTTTDGELVIHAKWTDFVINHRTASRKANGYITIKWKKKEKPWIIVYILQWMAAGILLFLIAYFNTIPSVTNALFGYIFGSSLCLFASSILEDPIDALIGGEKYHEIMEIISLSRFIPPSLEMYSTEYLLTCQMERGWTVRVKDIQWPRLTLEDDDINLGKFFTEVGEWDRNLKSLMEKKDSSGEVAQLWSLGIALSCRKWTLIRHILECEKTRPINCGKYRQTDVTSLDAVLLGLSLHETCEIVHDITKEIIEWIDVSPTAWSLVGHIIDISDLQMRPDDLRVEGITKTRFISQALQISVLGKKTELNNAQTVGIIFAHLNVESSILQWGPGTILDYLMKTCLLHELKINLNRFEIKCGRYRLWATGELNKVWNVKIHKMEGERPTGTPWTATYMQLLFDNVLSRSRRTLMGYNFTT